MTMLLDLSHVRGTRDRFDETYPASAFDTPDQDYRVVQPVTLGFDLFKSNRQFRLVGRVFTVLELSCGRCLEPFTLAVDLPFDVLYLPHTENTGEGETEVEDDDLETAFYRDETIDLGQLMKEQFYLAVPMKPLCREACRGLCPHCGTNLNQSSCDCQPEWVDPRLEALRSLARGEDKG
jgi:uncharacterized protein